MGFGKRVIQILEMKSYFKCNQAFFLKCYLISYPSMNMFSVLLFTFSIDFDLYKSFLVFLKVGHSWITFLYPAEA